MNIGILAINFPFQGEASAAILWRDAFRAHGHQADIISMSASGNIIARMRDDCDIDCYSWKDPDETAKALSSRDFIIAYNPGLPNEKTLDKSPYMDVMERVTVPLYIFCTSIAHLMIRHYKHTHDFFHLPTVSGLLFARDSTRRSFEEAMPDVMSSKPFLKTYHPFTIPDAPVRKPDGGVVAATALRPVKKTAKFLEAIREFDLLSSVDIELWGSGDRSRYAYLLEQEYGELFRAIYMGPYDRYDLDTVYENARYSVDLTTVKDDGGVQVCFLEAISRSVVPIVSPGWSVEGTCIELPSIESSDVAFGVQVASELDEDERQSYLFRGFEYMKEHHDSEQVISEFFSHFGV